MERGEIEEISEKTYRVKTYRVKLSKEVCELFGGKFDERDGSCIVTTKFDPKDPNKIEILKPRLEQTELRLREGY